MRISDWSSDVGSSDLGGAILADEVPPRRPDRTGDASVRLQRLHWHEPGRIDRGVAFVVMPLDVVEVHRAANPFDLHHAPGKRMQGRIVGDPPQVALEVPVVNRSEEHTSELQSLMRISYAVYCFKKKRTNEARQDTRYSISGDGSSQ